MGKIIKFQVTQEDIDKAEHSSLDKCVIANALNRTFKQTGITVGYGHAGIGLRNQYKLGPKVIKYIKAYDNNKIVLPAEFDLEILNESN